MLASLTLNVVSRPASIRARSLYSYFTTMYFFGGIPFRHVHTKCVVIAKRIAVSTPVAASWSKPSWSSKIATLLAKTKLMSTVPTVLLSVAWYRKLDKPKPRSSLPQEQGTWFYAREAQRLVLQCKTAQRAPWVEKVCRARQLLGLLSVNLVEYPLIFFHRSRYPRWDAV